MKTKLPFQLVSTAFSALAALSTVTATAQTKPQEPTALSATEVSDRSENDSAPSIGAAAALVAEVPGAAVVVDDSKVERGRVGTQADVLSFQPGVFAAPPAGSGDGIKISIRGSGIGRSAGNFFRSGVLFTFDGLPVTGAGGTPYELFETYGVAYTEVLLGGNAYDFGSLQLGGAINYVTHTGYDAPQFEVRYDLGSFGYNKFQFSAGAVSGKADYYVSASSLHIDGFQEHAKGKATGFAGNFGYKLTDSIETRFFLRYRRTENDNPGNISLNQLLTDPKVANPNNVVGNIDRTQPGSTWIANRTNIKIDSDSKLELGFVYHDAPIDIQPSPSPGTAVDPLAITERSIWTFHDITFEGKYSRTDTLFGLHSTTTLGASFDDEYAAGVKVYADNPNVITGPRAFRTLLKYADYNNSIDSSARLINETAVTDQFAVITGAGLAFIRRAGAVDYIEPGLPLAAPTPGNVGATIDRKSYYFVPRFGLRYDPNAHLSFFGNITRSIEAPNSWQLNHGSPGNYAYQDNIVDQKAIASEIGTRASYGAFLGSLSLYHTAVRDELLTVPIVPGDPSKGSYTFNGSKTYKNGIEFGLDTNLWNSAGFLKPVPTGKGVLPGNRLVLSQSFSYNDFKYKNDPTFGKNELPGVPREYYQARLQFDHVSGFYAGISFQDASSYYVDFANHLEAPAYTLWGANLGYENPKQHWQVYVDFRNIFDKKYASSAGPTFDAGPASTNRTNPLFQAGDGFGVTTGITLRL